MSYQWTPDASGEGSGLRGRVMLGDANLPLDLTQFDQVRGVGRRAGPRTTASRCCCHQRTI